jgi:hypothetical protein
VATQKFKLATNNAEFPFTYGRAGRSVVQPGLDVAPRTSVQFVGTPESFDYNLVKMIYCENVLPIAEGVQSVATQEDFPAYVGPVTDFDQFVTLRDSKERNFMFSPGRGKNYVLSNTLGTWGSYNSFSWGASKTIVSRAYVNGRTFICYEADRIIEWDPVGLVFNTIVLTFPPGFSITDIRGICGASNYLLLFTDTTILWSSLLDVTNFNDAIGKSGKQIPIDLKGQITALVPISGGFIIYTNRNAVAAFFTNSADTPFSYREVQGSGGVSTYEQVTGDANQAEHFTYGSSGLQQLNLQNAVSVFPDCADFLSSKEYASWNTVTGTIDETALTGTLDVKLQLLANRYLVISYGKINGQFTFALVFDTVLRRWGKIRVNHVDVSVLPGTVLNLLGYRIYELTAPISSYTVAIQDLRQQFGDIVPLRAGFAFLQNTGAIRNLLADPTAAVGEGVVIFGHVQIVRSRAVTFQGAQFDGLFATPLPKVRLWGSLPNDGYTRDQIDTVTNVLNKPKTQRYTGRKTYENFDIVVEGKFQLTTGLVETTVHGSR